MLRFSSRNSIHRPSHLAGSESAYQYLDTSSVIAREARRAIKRAKRRLSRLLRASPNILIPDARNTRCGSFFKMLLVLRASVGHLHNLNRHLREVCAGFIRVICRWHRDSGQAADRISKKGEAIHLRTVAAGARRREI